MRDVTDHIAQDDELNLGIVYSLWVL